MATGGVFKLIANDGKTDRLLLATALLNQRLIDIACARRRAQKDPTPTLMDIERTHILFVNAHFKPFAALGYEYNKVQSSSGSPALGGKIQFSIPQFGDFFHDMVLRTRFSAVTSSVQTSPTAGDTIAPSAGPYGLGSSFPGANENWDNDTALPTTTYALVDAFGTSIATPGTTQFYNMVRYVEYPAERLCSSVSFQVNGNPLDEYSYRVSSMLRKFTISDEKLVGYKRLVGQEVPFEGFTGPRVCRIEDSDFNASAPTTTAAHGPATGPYNGSPYNQGNTQATYMYAPHYEGGNFNAQQWNAANSATTQTVVNVGAGTVVAVESGAPGPSGAQWGHVQRGAIQAVDGPQTPKYQQPQLEVWNRLSFWFNLDARLSVPSVAIPYGQRFITIDLATQAELIQEFPGIFVQQTIDAPVTLATTVAGTYGLIRNFRPWWSGGTISTATLSNVELYINNIFVNPEIHDIFIRRVGFSLIRVYRVHTATKSQASEDQELLSQLKWPIECLFIGFQPQINVKNQTSAGGHQHYHRDWHRMGKSFDSVCGLRQVAQLPTITGASNNAYVFTSDIGQIVPDTYVVDRPTVTTVSLTAHGVKIHDSFPHAFFSSYEPFHYGGSAIRPSTDPGAMMINFALFPGCYQPSAYLNTSRARELYLSWTSSFVTSTTGIHLIAVGIAINFLLVTDGSAVLRFST